jgi:hypothetical protein
VRISGAELLEAGYALAPPALPGLGNCFNTGLCAWLCHHRGALQIALGVETVLLLVLIALYRWLNRQMEQEGLDADEVSAYDQPGHDAPIVVRRGVT